MSFILRFSLNIRNKENIGTVLIYLSIFKIEPISKMQSPWSALRVECTLFRLLV